MNNVRRPKTAKKIAARGPHRPKHNNSVPTNSHLKPAISTDCAGISMDDVVTKKGHIGKPSAKAVKTAPKAPVAGIDVSNEEAVASSRRHVRETAYTLAAKRLDESAGGWREPGDAPAAAAVSSLLNLAEYAEIADLQFGHGSAEIEGSVMMVYAPEHVFMLTREGDLYCKEVSDPREFVLKNRVRSHEGFARAISVDPLPPDSYALHHWTGANEDAGQAQDVDPVPAAAAAAAESGIRDMWKYLRVAGATNGTAEMDGPDVVLRTGFPYRMEYRLTPERRLTFTKQSAHTGDTAYVYRATIGSPEEFAAALDTPFTDDAWERQ